MSGVRGLRARDLGRCRMGAVVMLEGCGQSRIQVGTVAFERPVS